MRPARRCMQVCKLSQPNSCGFSQILQSVVRRFVIPVTVVRVLYSLRRSEINRSLLQRTHDCRIASVSPSTPRLVVPSSEQQPVSPPAAAPPFGFRVRQLTRKRLLAASSRRFAGACVHVPAGPPTGACHRVRRSASKMRPAANVR
jgi:hypothetical protein